MFGLRHDLDQAALVVIGRIGLGLLVGFDRGAADGNARQQRLSQCNGVGRILVAQRRGEGGAGKVTGGHPRRMADHLWACHRAGRKRLCHQFHVEAGLLRDRKAFGKARNLHRAHQIIDQLEHRAGAYAAEMADGRAERLEEGLCLLEIGRIGPDQQRQLALGCCRRKAGHGTVDIDQTSPGQLARHFQGMGVGDGGAFDRERAGLHVGRGTILAEPDGARGLVIGHHGNDRIRIDGGVFRRGRPVRAARDQILRFGPAAIPHRDGKTGIEIAAGHAVAHPSEPDEGDARHR